MSDTYISIPLVPALKLGGSVKAVGTRALTVTTGLIISRLSQLPIRLDNKKPQKNRSFLVLLWGYWFAFSVLLYAILPRIRPHHLGGPKNPRARPLGATLARMGLVFTWAILLLEAMDETVPHLPQAHWRWVYAGIVTGIVLGVIFLCNVWLVTDTSTQHTGAEYATTEVFVGLAIVITLTWNTLLGERLRWDKDASRLAWLWLYFGISTGMAAVFFALIRVIAPNAAEDYSRPIALHAKPNTLLSFGVFSYQITQILLQAVAFNVSISFLHASSLSIQQIMGDSLGAIAQPPATLLFTFSFAVVVGAPFLIIPQTLVCFMRRDAARRVVCAPSLCALCVSLYLCRLS